MKSFRRVDEWGTIYYRNEKGDFHREDGPAYEETSGYRVWYINGKWHREDGPAYEKPSGTKEWFINGKRHREDGPAVEYSSGHIEYFLNDNYYTKEEWEKEILKRKLERIKDL